MFMAPVQSFQTAEKVFPAKAAPAFAVRSGIFRLRSQGIAGDTLVDTAGGWVPARLLRRGTLIHTMDGGLRPLAEIEIRPLWPTAAETLVHVPGGALDNCDALHLLPGQHLLVASPIIRAVLGMPHVLIRAGDLDGFRGIAVQQPATTIDMVQLHFSQEEVVFLNSGTLAHCGAVHHPVHHRPAHRGGAGHFTTLTQEQASACLALIADGVLSTADLAAAPDAGRADLRRVA